MKEPSLQIASDFADRLDVRPTNREPLALERARLKRLLDDSHEILRDDHSISLVSKTVEDLVIGLFEIQQRCGEEAWVFDLALDCRRHPISALLQQDPYTARALQKPRGFAGDAVMLDFLYDASAGSEVSRLGAEIFKATALTSSGRSVVERRELIADRITHTATNTSRAKIVSLACGHLRELELVDSHVQESIGEFIAMDQDIKALERVKASSYAAAPRILHASVKQLLAGRTEELEGIDFAYAAGLFDYLSDAVGMRLVKSLCERLAPGGRLLVGNFTPRNWGRGYMDAFMEWHLTYRSAADLRMIGRQAGVDRRIAIENVFEDNLGNVAYLELVVA